MVRISIYSINHVEFTRKLEVSMLDGRGDKVDLRVNQAIERLYNERVFSTYANQVIITPKAR